MRQNTPSSLARSDIAEALHGLGRRHPRSASRVSALALPVPCSANRLPPSARCPAPAASLPRSCACCLPPAAAITLAVLNAALCCIRPERRPPFSKLHLEKVARRTKIRKTPRSRRRIPDFRRYSHRIRGGRRRGEGPIRVFVVIRIESGMGRFFRCVLRIFVQGTKLSAWQRRWLWRIRYGAPSPRTSLQPIGAGACGSCSENATCKGGNEGGCSENATFHHPPPPLSTWRVGIFTAMYRKRHIRRGESRWLYRSRAVRRRGQRWMQRAGQEVGGSDYATFSRCPCSLRPSPLPRGIAPS
jgi:hypothetical protein